MKDFLTEMEELMEMSVKRRRRLLKIIGLVLCLAVFDLSRSVWNTEPVWLFRFCLFVLVVTLGIHQLTAWRRLELMEAKERAAGAVPCQGPDGGGNDQAA